MHHDSRWTVTKISRRLALIEPLVYRRKEELVLSTDTGPLKPGHYWGPGGLDFELKARFRVPWPGLAALWLPLGEAGDFSHPEALVFLDGEPHGSCDRHHQELPLPERVCDGEWHELTVKGWTGTGLDQDTHLPLTHPRLLMQPCAVVGIDQPTRDFVALARVAHGIAQNLDPTDPARGRLLNALDEAFILLDTREPLGEAFYASVPGAHAALQAGIEKAGPPLDVTLVAAGHAHIDVAWLWTLAQTRQKAARSFHNVLQLMERFPGFHFTQSQPQLYDYVREDHPELFERIRERVKEGRWEPIGGMWVEADANLSGGEALVRQFLLGRRFFAEHFGPTAETRVLWLPDVFGYPACLPQLIRGAGLDYFFTIKIGWSQYNKIPYDSFWWQGLDGTRVLTHFSTAPDLSGTHASTYNAFATPEQVLGTWRTLRNKEKQSSVLMAFGHGDGGGGPTREMIENLELMRRFPSTPQVRCGTVKGFFEELEGAGLPVWDGELYLELHRGTYTSQARTKRANRKSEVLLHEAEFLATLASLRGKPYPHADLERAWKLLCLHQFHDILPGSSIGAVYADSQRDYATIEEIGNRLVEEALAGSELCAVNPCPFGRHELVWCSGQNLPGAQPSEGGCWLDPGPLPRYSVTALRPQPAGETGLVASEQVLENRFLRAEFNAGGQLVSLYDNVHHRQVLPPGARGNVLCAFEDRPMNYEAWDVDIFFEDRCWYPEPVSVRLVESGPLRAALEVESRLGSSRIVQRIILSSLSPRLDFETHVEWRERRVLLKAAFPVAVLSPQATHEVQWGHVTRPTHRNTSWDWARFETCAHKWIDLSEDDYGVSLLNDCKYGHDVSESTLRVTLLRSPTAPDPDADQGSHVFTYSLLCHGRGLDDTVAEGYRLNHPVRVAQAVPHGSLASASPESAVIETLKQAEDGRGVIVRLYQSQRRRGPVSVRVGFPVSAAWRCDLLERNLHELKVEGDTVRLELGPFEIATLRFS